MNQLGQEKMEAAKETVLTSSRLMLKKQKEPGLWITAVEGPVRKEFHLTLQPLPGEKLKAMVRRLAALLREKNATVVRHEILGSKAAHTETMQILHRELHNFDWPVMWIGSDGNTSSTISGMHLFAVAGVRVDTIYQGEESIGRVFGDGQTRCCLLSGLRPANLSASKSAQCQEVFRNLERGLCEADMNIANVARTWFFLDAIHSWYGEFNGARNEFFQKKKLIGNLLPASTGVGSQNPAGSAVSVGAWAVQATKDCVSIIEVPSPLQCSSVEYGSAFSRAVLVETPLWRRLLISGTASIGPDGRSLHIGDLPGQIGLTMEVVREILASCDLDFSHVTRATAYFKNSQDAPAFDLWRKQQRLEPFPLIVTQSDICRPELLFEIELDAISLVKLN